MSEKKYNPINDSYQYHVLSDKYDKAVAVLVELEQGKGPYSMDHGQHAKNVIAAMKSLAKECLDELGIEREWLKIQDHFGADEIHKVAEKIIVSMGFKPRQDEIYPDLTFHRYLFSYLNQEGANVCVLFHYDEDNIEEYFYKTGKGFLSFGHWDRDLLLGAFFGGKQDA